MSFYSANPADDTANLTRLAQAALIEVGEVLAGVPQALATGFVTEVQAAGRVALYGVGREGLVMRSLAMRLYHAGKQAFVVGDMAAEPIGPGDLLIVSAGPGEFATVTALMAVAHGAGARTLAFSAEPGGLTSRQADVLLHLPAQTMHSDESRHASTGSVLPMGSLYELSLWLLCDLLIEELKRAGGISAPAMRERHTNLE